MGEARFSWHAADGDVRYGLDAAEPRAPPGDGPRRPPGVAPWRTRAGRGDDPRLGLAACPGVSRPPARLAREHAAGPLPDQSPLGVAGRPGRRSTGHGGLPVGRPQVGEPALVDRRQQVRPPGLRGPAASPARPREQLLALAPRQPDPVLGHGMSLLAVATTGHPITLNK